MGYQTLVEKVESALDKYVKRVQDRIEFTRQNQVIPGLWEFMVPNLYIAKGVREGVMFLLNPSDRIQKWIEYYRKNKNI